MVDLLRLIRAENLPPEALREWLVENGLGGYASATMTGAITRRYHGFLIAAQPAPLGRMVVLNDLEVDIERADGSVVNLRENGRFLDFTLDMGLPSWRYELDGVVLRTFGHYVRDGLIPNLFPEGQNQGLYHTADATLWFFHALHRYVEHCGDKETLELLVPILKDIVRHHLAGTRFGIKVDPHDGLLTQGAEGYALTWMDAKVGDWVVTPRRGKAVEINALWYNALCLLADWLRDAHDPEAAAIAAHADKTRSSFNRRFWHATGGYLYDIVDGEAGDDAAFRPNQIFAIALDHPVLDREYWETVVTAVHAKLVTPVGLRSLAPGEPDYKPRYFGDLRARDAAYHQGTVWAWLIGPFIDAWLKVYPDDYATARHFLDSFEPHLAEAGIGSISEVFDAEPPFTPRGCIAQAWSVAEVLRCLNKTAPDQKILACS